MPDIFCLILVPAVRKVYQPKSFRRAIVGKSKENYKMVSFRIQEPTLNLRMCVFPQFVIVKFNVYPRFHIISSTPQFIRAFICPLFNSLSTNVVC